MCALPQAIQAGLVNDPVFRRGYHCLWSLADTKYAGVALLVRRSLMAAPAPAVAFSLEAEDGRHHKDGRVVTVRCTGRDGHFVPAEGQAAGGQGEGQGRSGWRPYNMAAAAGSSSGEASTSRGESSRPMNIDLYRTVVLPSKRRSSSRGWWW